MNRNKINMNFDGTRNQAEKKAYMGHLERIKDPEKKIDNSAPYLPTTFYYNPGALDSDTRRIDVIDTLNTNLLKEINTIYRTIGKVDCTSPSLIKSTNYFIRLNQNKWIEAENKKIYENFKIKESQYNRKHLERQYMKNLQNIIFSARHPEYYNEDYFLLPLERWDIINPSLPKPNLLPPCEPKRVRCFLDIGVHDKMGLRKLGRLLIEVYRDWAPKQSDHFLSLVRGFDGKSYVGSPFHRIQKGFACVAGDVTKKTGVGVYSIFDECYPNENNFLQFNGPGVVSSFSLKPGHNHSQFLISFTRLDVCNKEFTVFGRVVVSLGTLRSIEEYGTASGAPTKKIVITKCGILKANTDFLDDVLERYPKLNLGRRLTKRMKQEIEKFAMRSECGCPLYRALPDSSSDIDYFTLHERKEDANECGREISVSCTPELPEEQEVVERKESLGVEKKKRDRIQWKTESIVSI